jgi:hypothetical protein
MGNANCNISNQLDKPLTVLTFNNADTVYANRNNLYQVAPFGGSRVEAAADTLGLKVGIVYGIVGNTMLTRMWSCSNGETLDVQSIYYDQIYTDGCQHLGTNEINADSDTVAGIMQYLGLTLDVVAAAGGFFYL